MSGVLSRLAKAWRHFRQPAPVIVPVSSERETSMNFDMEDVIPFFDRLIAHPILKADAQTLKDIFREIQTLPVEETLRGSMITTVDGKRYRTRLEVFMDDIDAPDLYFFGHPAPIELIDNA